MKYWFSLLLAIIVGVIGTSALKASVDFSRLWPSIFVICRYGIAFYFLSLKLRSYDPLSLSHILP